MLYTAKDIYRVATPQAYRAIVETRMAKRRAQGFTHARAVTIADPIVAYVNHGRWVIDCDCGAGNAVQPEWKLACCLSCGAIRTNVVLPTNRAAIERVLAARLRDANRNWYPRETVADLHAENAAHPRLVKGGQ